ncbi:MAG TPA: flp pilus-assembly TadE/G-like family protein [Aeromicrobium sp.]|nr:flp pilus-assembly TadE/G-like family protein [Aeromicrobium sp.]
MKRSSARGSASVQALSVVALLLLLAMVCLQAALVIGLRQKAAQAADLAALAASRTSVEGGEPCEVASTVAKENGATLRDCQMDADVATVKVRARAERWAIGNWSAEQRARAAPSWYLE